MFRKVIRLPAGAMPPQVGKKKARKNDNESMQRLSKKQLLGMVAAADAEKDLMRAEILHLKTENASITVRLEQLHEEG